MCVRASLKHPVGAIGFLKGKSAIAMAREVREREELSGEHFWARGYAASSVGFGLEQVRNTSASRNSRRWHTRTILNLN